MAAMRDWCLGDVGVARGETTVLLHVSHSNLKKTFFQEIRLDMHMTIANVKHKLEFHTGTSAMSNTVSERRSRIITGDTRTRPIRANPAGIRRRAPFALRRLLCSSCTRLLPNRLALLTHLSPVQLYLLDEEGNMMAECEDDKKLGYYSPYDQCRLHIVDLDPNSASAGGWLEDTSLVTKYEISEEAYNARADSYRKFKAAKVAEDPNWTMRGEMERRRAEKDGRPAPPMEARPPPAPKVEDEEFQAEAAGKVAVGDRCEAAGGRRGEVMFVGKVPELPLGWWVGVKYDEPVGKNDGSVKGARYFECADGYGGFLRPELVQVGDFPEDDPFADLADEM